MIMAIQMALLVAIILYIILLISELFEKIKTNKTKKETKAIIDLIKMTILAAIADELNINKKNNKAKEKTK